VATPTEGIMCLANDAVLDNLIALCESVRTHSPNCALTVIPFDANLARTRAVLADFGYDLYDDPSLVAMDSVGSSFWPNEATKQHFLRKFCAFWGPYDTFVFLDADIVLLQGVEQYFEAFRDHDADLMYLATDIDNVYRPGPVRDEMISEFDSVGFNAGHFVARRGVLTEAMLVILARASLGYREAFVDLAEQPLVNFVVDRYRLRKVDAHAALPDVVEAAALMRLKRDSAGFILADPRVPESGRPVTMIHWSGYRAGPFMPYRSTFLAYRLAQAGPLARVIYRLRAFMAEYRRLSHRSLRHLTRELRVRSHNVLASRGLREWR
jgi:hypothetical protein